MRVHRLLLSCRCVWMWSGGDEQAGVRAHPLGTTHRPPCALPPAAAAIAAARTARSLRQALCARTAPRARTADVRASSALAGVNLGGWMVIQPWITPSLFYQFEGKPPAQTAMDMHGFCRVLGPTEGNRQLREHWRKWVTESDLRRLAKTGVNSVRLPVGDWIWTPYEPYVGCTDGSLDELWRPATPPPHLYPYPTPTLPLPYPYPTPTLPLSYPY